ncbi:proton-coupled amino acid transporter 1 [Elysia marginata]|uniref:Proton-coupled amino acid transporter 1 n=1 Tax=Elysia marginata TaxID=1093978 RepID=A0AAV4FSD2_9GAST|nr:proton-coupled amino acid transporter 1 [Elysia marginata]
MKPVSSVSLTPQDPWTIPLFIGGAVFTVEGIAMILPIENRTRHPKDYTGPFGMVALATATNVLVNLATGFYGYLAFGDEASGNILVSLPNMWLYRLVSIMYASMVFLTFNLQLYQPAEAIYAWLIQKVKSEFVHKYGNIATRTVLVILTFLFAVLVPRVDLMMALIGAFCAGFLVFILPIISELLLLHSEPGGIGWVTWVKDILILLFGVLAFVTGTYTSLRDIVKAFNLKH